MSSNTIPAPDPQPSKSDLYKVARGVLAGVVTGVAFGLGGFFLVYAENDQMGNVLFFLLPFATGFATSLVTKGTNLLFASLIISALVCTAILVFFGVEGWVCVIFSAPILAVCLSVGAFLGYLVRNGIENQHYKQWLSLLLLAVLPFFLAGANKVEKAHSGPRAETFSNTLVTDAPRELVWEQLKTFDRIEGTKGFLMRIGLPVPVSCTMSGEGVGATRTCYFESGHIEERVTEWNPPSSMKFEITRFDVPGRPWLSFKDASYDLTTDGGRTVVTRKTTIVSNLSPAWYWRPLEKIGVETEHEYLFEEVKRKIEGAK